MKQLNEKQLKRLKEIELDALLEIDRVCRKNNIKYSLAYGTLIGAVRHKGFIPWDDDVDIMLDRKNYNKLIDVFEKETNNSNLKLYNASNSSFAFLYSKIMNMEYKMQETNNFKSEAPNGVFIDIFPFDPLYDDPHKRINLFNKTLNYRRIMPYREKYHVNTKLINKIIFSFIGFIWRLKKKNKLLEKYDEYINEANNISNFKEYGLYGEYDLAMNTYPKHTFEKFTELEFEGHSLMVVDNYDEILRISYGDYLKLPPIEKRKPQHEVIDFYLGEGY